MHPLNLIITGDNQGIENSSNRVESGKKTGRKQPTMAITLGFLIDNFFL